MRQFSYILVVFFMTVLMKPRGLFSQSIKVISATSQGWAGGVCCRTGINYHIQLQISDKRKTIKLDSLWMNGNCASIAKYYIPKSCKTDSCFVNLDEGVTWDDGMPMNNWCYDHRKKGVVISYYLRGRKKWLDISPYMIELEFMAFP